MAIYEEITRTNELFSDAFKRGDAEGVANLYTEAGQLGPANSDFLTGRSAIQGFIQGHSLSVSSPSPSVSLSAEPARSGQISDIILFRTRPSGLAILRPLSPPAQSPPFSPLII